MSEKKMPPAPSLPPTVEKINDDFCLFHRGKIENDVYTCPSCKSKYCLDCAKKARSEGKYCVKCKQLILI